MGYKSCPHEKKNYGGFACMGNQTQMSANVDAITKADVEQRRGTLIFNQSINQSTNQSLINRFIFRDNILHDNHNRIDTRDLERLPEKHNTQ